MDPLTVILIIITIISILIAISQFQSGKAAGKSETDMLWQKELMPKIKAEAIKKSRAVIGGQFSEQLAPFLPDFPYKPTECTFIGKPIDILVFKGMDDKEISEVKFIEIKSGRSNLSTHERKLRNAIQEGKVTWELYRIPEEITNSKE